MIHTVGPVWRGGGSGEAALLASCYRASLSLADESGVESIAFPAISCGVYGYPPELAVEIAVREVRDWLGSRDMDSRVVFACFGREMAALYRASVGG